MNDAAAGGHPLHVARRDDPAVAQAVAVFDVAAQDVGDGLDPAMGMPGEAGQIIRGILVAKVVEKQEWVEVAGVPEPKGAPKMNSCALQRGL